MSVQNEYSLLHREPEADVLAGVRAARPRVPPVFPARERPADRQVPKGVPPPKGTPDADGAGRPSGLTERTSRSSKSLREIAGRARALDAGARVLVAAAARRVASVIAGATKPEQVRANAAGGGLEDCRRRILRAIDSCC